MKSKCFSAFTLNFFLLLFLCRVSDSKLLPELVNRGEEARNRALEWLTSQREDDYGWGIDTARVVTAIAAAVEDWPLKEGLDARLSAKQLEIELLGRLLRNETDPISPGRLALYSLSLNAICMDPKDFHGYNLIDALGKHHVDQDYPGYPEAYGYSLSSLITCLNDDHLRKHQIRHLIQIVRDDTGEHTTDTRSLSLMALECVRRHRHSESLTRHILEGLEALAETQKPDGSFGNTHTTAMAIQGFASSVYPTRFWNETSALLSVLSKQGKNGSFANDIHVTTDVVLAMSTLLKGSGLLGIKRNRCKGFTNNHPNLLAEIWNSSTTTPKSSSTTNTTSTQTGDEGKLGKRGQEQETQIETTSELTQNPEVTTGSETSSPFPSSTVSQGPDIVVKYWLWIGNDPLTAVKHNLTVRTAVNSTFYHLMLQAAQASEVYEFSSTLWPNGHYIHTVSGQHEQPVGYHYWLLYRLPTDPDPNNPPPTTYIAPGGVDDLIVHDGETYMFWFKKI